MSNDNISLTGPEVQDLIDHLERAKRGICEASMPVDPGAPLAELNYVIGALQHRMDQREAAIVDDMNRPGETDEQYFFRRRRELGL